MSSMAAVCCISVNFCCNSICLVKYSFVCFNCWLNSYSFCVFFSVDLTTFSLPDVVILYSLSSNVAFVIKFLASFINNASCFSAACNAFSFNASTLEPTSSPIPKNDVPVFLFARSVLACSNSNFLTVASAAFVINAFACALNPAA